MADTVRTNERSGDVDLDAPEVASMTTAAGEDADSGADADALFAHLQELVDELPRMQELDERLSRAVAAARLEELARDKRTQDGMLRQAQEILDRARAALDRARETGDPEAIETAEREVLAGGQARGIRIAPARNAQDALDEALAQSPFDTLDEALTVFARLAAEGGELATRAGRDACAARIAAYRRDYDETFAACQAADVEEG